MLTDWDNKLKNQSNFFPYLQYENLTDYFPIPTGFGETNFYSFYIGVRSFCRLVLVENFWFQPAFATLGNANMGKKYCNFFRNPRNKK